MTESATLGSLPPSRRAPMDAGLHEPSQDMKKHPFISS
jgi:hypothetical protein